jgi:hypothetical protein
MGGIHFIQNAGLVGLYERVLERSRSTLLGPNLHPDLETPSLSLSA